MSTSTGKLKLELVDVHGKPLKENVDVSLRNLLLTHKPFLKNFDAKKTIDGLSTAPKGSYQVDVTPPSYMPVSVIVNIKPSGVTTERIVFPVDPAKVVSVDFPKFSKVAADLRPILEVSRNLLGHEGKVGETLYNDIALDEVSCAGMLNIVAKTGTTLLTNGKSVLSMITEFRELRGDRLFAVVPKELREATKNSAIAGLLDPVPDQHHNIPGQFAGFTHAGSFKTKESAGNLQMTFFMKGDDCVADIDIDDAGGIGHIFQVLRNFLLNRRTHPYDIHQILVFRQKIDPGYSFNLS